MQNLLQFLTIFFACCSPADINVDTASRQKTNLNKQKAITIAPLKISPEQIKTSIAVLEKRKKEKRILEFVEIHKSKLKNQKLFSFVDYSMSINKKRFFVFDLKKKKIIYSTFVGHSGYSGETIPWDTSNVPNTRKTSLGLFKVGAQYHGRFGKSKRLHGLSKTNSNAFRRAIVAHSMQGDEVEDLYSWGCFTFFKKDLNKAFSYMKKGTYLLAVD